MEFFGLSLDNPLVPNVDAYINPAKDEDTHRSALNAVVSTRPFSWTHDTPRCPPVYYFKILCEWSYAAHRAAGCIVA